MKRGRPPPQWFLDRPDLAAASEWYVEAFWDLSTGRPGSDYSVHPIPWRDIVDYAALHGLDSDNYQVLRLVIREMDATYRKWRAAEAERKLKQKQSPEQ